MKNQRLYTRFARDDADLCAAQRLRYDVFVTEMGAHGVGVDDHNQLETDRFDRFAQHLLLIDEDLEGNDQVVGVYRLMTRSDALKAGQFYSGSEFDLDLLLASNRRILELGRTCVHPRYRNGMALAVLWQGLTDFVRMHDIDILFGTASFQGTDIAKLREPLAHLHQAYLVGPELRVMAHGDGAIAMDSFAQVDVDRVRAMRQMPALIKSYLRLGGRIGAGAYVDDAFNTTDVFLILDVAALSPLAQDRLRQRDLK